ncbi:MAG: isoprenylcysteine carboxylmethyltransferase family protein [Candidatus Aenigmatarchaeota archaeon]
MSIGRREIFALHILILLFIFTFRNQFLADAWLSIASSLITIPGLLIVITGAITLDKAKNLATNGIYSRIRHPIYYGRILFFIGIALFLKSIYGLVLTLLVILPLHIHIIREEEKLLAGKYGKKYNRYKKQTLF